MSRLLTIYVKVGRVVGSVMILGLKLYTTLTRRPRVRVIAVNEQGEILLVSGVVSYRGQWTLPGGGVNRHETWSAAASRELYEETGIKKPAGEFLYVKTIKRGELKLDFDAPLYRITVAKDELPATLFNPWEIADAAWFHPHELPAVTTTLVRTIAKEHYMKHSQKSDG